MRRVAGANVVKLDLGGSSLVATVAGVETGHTPIPPMTHTPVLADEVLRLLDPRPGETYVDATAGLGGHARRVAERLGPTGRVILLDLDADNVARAAETVRGAAECEVIPIHASFTELARLLRELPGAADLILADLGFASNQVDDPARGLSFKRDGPLDMRLDPTAVITAADLVAELPEKELADLIYEYGEERLSRKIARFLVAERKAEPITTTARLAMLVRRAYGRQRGRSRIDPATRTFQALRIAVNDELGNLGSLLEDVARSAGRGQDADWLAPGARIAMISFHSLEDRLIKRAFADMVERGWATGLTKKPITADARGIEENPRARSAKLRAVRLAGGAHASLDSPTARQT